MSGQDQNPAYVSPDNGKSKEGEENSARNAQANLDFLYTDEPERLFHQRNREAAEIRRKEAIEQAAREQAAELYRQLLQDPNFNRPPQPVNNPVYANINNQPQPRINNQRYQQQQYVPVQPAYQGQVRQQHRQPCREELPMKDFSIPTLENQAWCINTDTEEDGFEIKTNIVHYLPKFAGLPGEVAVLHLKEFEGVCKSLKPYAAPEDKFKLSMFPFSLTDIAKSWFLSLPSISIHTWEQMQRKFLEKFYPAGRANQVRRELSVIKQGPMESTYEYLERFNSLEQSCCNLGIPDHLLVDY